MLQILEEQAHFEDQEQLDLMHALPSNRMSANTTTIRKTFLLLATSCLFLRAVATA